MKINPGFPLQKHHSTRRLFTSKLSLNLKKKLVKCYMWRIALYGAETWILRKVDRKYVESFEMWWWRTMEKISCTDRVRNEVVMRCVKVERNILNTIKRRKANWIGCTLRRNCLPEQVNEER
jgi:hypothetical protein